MKTKSYFNVRELISDIVLLLLIIVGIDMKMPVWIIITAVIVTIVLVRIFFTYNPNANKEMSAWLFWLLLMIAVVGGSRFISILM